MIQQVEYLIGIQTSTGPLSVYRYRNRKFMKFCTERVHLHICITTETESHHVRLLVATDKGNTITELISS